MKKTKILMLFLMISMIASAQKMTIKTSKGQVVEVSCEGGMLPDEVKVAPDGSVTFKIAKVLAVPIMEPKIEEDIDSVDTFEEVDSLSEIKDTLFADNIIEITDTLVADKSIEITDTLVEDSLYDSQQSTLGIIANAIAEELSPEYAAFNKEHEGTHPASERELVKGIAKQFFNEKDVETADAVATVLGSIFKRDSTFVPTYEKRKPKPLWRTYDIIELSGSLGKNISNINEAMANKLDAEDYGDDAENHQKYGGGIKYSRLYMKGSEVDGVWKPNPLYFAWSLGGLASYSYEHEIGSYVSLMGKVGAQIGSDICIGVDALMGGGITPYNTFLTNDVNYNLINKSVLCFKYGIQFWGSLNFSKDTYTAVFGRYIRSVKPRGGNFSLSNEWELVYEDFDPNSWTVGLAVGYKFGAPQPLSQDKRLQAGIYTGYHLNGNKGMMISAELERLTQVSHSTSLSYGLSVENVFGHEKTGKNCAGLMLSTGFQVCQPCSSWFWGAKLLGGVGEYPIVNSSKAINCEIKDFSKRLCGRGALQFNTGLKIGKCSSLSCNIRAGYHLGINMDFENFEESQTENIKGFDLSAALGYNFIF